MTEVAWEVVILLLLVLLNGFFAMSEIAVVSARRARLQQRADAGDRGASAAVALAESPQRFLATVQVGITLIGIVAGAFGGATLAEELAVPLASIPGLAPYSEPIAVTAVVLAVTYLSLVVGELAPKRIGLAQAERIAGIVAVPMDALSRVLSPVVGFLSGSTSLVLRCLPLASEKEAAVTEEEVRLMIREGTEEGVFSDEEHAMIEGVLQLNDLTVEALMTPRRDVVWIDVRETYESAAAKFASSGHLHMPIAQDDLDHIMGIVAVTELLPSVLAERPVDLRGLARQAIYVPEKMSAGELLARFRETRTPVAIVIDDAGGFEGLVTVDDVVVAIMGDAHRIGSDDEPRAVARDDGSWLVDGRLKIDRFRAHVGADALPPGEGDDYVTVGGLIVTIAGRLPEVGERFLWGEWSYEVVDMDGRRVDKVLVERR